jgi:hypothetical protein
LSEKSPERLPRGPILGRVEKATLFRIVMFGTLLFTILYLREPCSQSVGGLFRDLESGADSDTADAGVEYIHLTPEEIQKRFPVSPQKP